MSVLKRKNSNELSTQNEKLRQTIDALKQENVELRKGIAFLHALQHQLVTIIQRNKSPKDMN